MDFIGLILSVALWTWSRQVSNRNECQEHPLGGKGGRCAWLISRQLQRLGTLRASPGMYWGSFT